MGKKYCTERMKKKVEFAVKTLDLKIIHMLYEQNYKLLCEHIGDKKYIAREQMLTEADKVIRKALKLNYPAKSLKIDYHFTRQEKTIIDYLCRNILTTHANYGILDSIEE
jgi:hypothetical protein